MPAAQSTVNPRLPLPGADALAASQALRARIACEIDAAGGWISFARYMDLALYAPGLGYYTAGAAKLGECGDFATAPEISPLFARAVARQLAQLVASGAEEILELGAGSGRLAAGALLEMERGGRLPQRYRILEVSPELRERQRALLASHAPRLLERVSWVDVLPRRIHGVVLANEVLDALPVHVVAWREQDILERGVALESGAFVWRERPADAQLLRAAQAIEVAPPYVSEIGLHARALVATLAQRLERGVLLFIDYGFGRAEYYHPQRNTGTLMCHYRHRVHDDPFALPGLQDITAHLDFTAVAKAAQQEGLALLGYTTQAQFLLNCGLIDLLRETPAEDAARYLPQAAAVQKLVSPAEMGELFKAIALGRGVEPPLLGFARGDQSRLL